MLAINNLKKHRPEIQPSGLRAALRRILTDILTDEGEPPLSEKELWELCGFKDVGFVPGVAFLDVERKTLELYEMSTLSDDKLRTIQRFGHDLYDEHGWYTELWVADRYGLSPNKIWEVRAEIAWNFENKDGSVEWLSEAEIDKRVAAERNISVEELQRQDESDQQEG